ncbi:MAG TPA: hypothetical protein VNX02_07485 [Steroidobacteraceae bacterium]|nr:hypothetical protein [Steroidobacteraceae bacterium]
MPQSPVPPAVPAGSYPRTYRLALWVYLLMVPVGLAICAAGVGLAFLLTRQQSSPAAMLGVVALVAVVGGFGAWLIASALRSKVVLREDAIEVHGVLRVRRLARAEIAGRRLQSLQYGQKMLLLEATDPATRALKLSSASSLRTDAVWDAWMASLPDLDAQETQALEAEVAANPELGSTPEERLGRLAAARRLAQWTNYVTYAIAAWGYLYPRPYGAAVLALGVLPWVALVLVAKSTGLFRLDGRRADPRPSLMLPVIIPGLVLLVRAVSDVGVLDLERALIFAAVTAFVLGWAALRCDAAMRARPWNALRLMLLGCAYGYGTVVLANSQLDFAPGDEYRVAVLARHVSRGSRSTSYYLRLDRWGPRTGPADVRVSAQLYRDAQPGTTVCVHRGPGALGIPWYAVDLCGP